jgi:acyl carrier protein
MDVLQAVRGVLDEVLSLNGRSAAFTGDTPLLGALPELDSMAVVALIGAIEDRFGIAIDDDEISGDSFATVGTLADLVATKLAG